MKSKNKLEKILSGLPNYDITQQDVKAMAISFILDQEDLSDDDVEKSRGTRSRLKLETLRLLHDIVKSESGGDLESSILAVISNKSPVNKHAVEDEED